MIILTGNVQNRQIQRQEGNQRCQGPGEGRMGSILQGTECLFGIMDKF